MKRTVATFSLLAWLAMVPAPSGAAGAPLPAPRPNLIFFLVDDMGWQDTSVPFWYSNGVPVMTEFNRLYRTPAMEALAASGRKFTSAYASAVCSPTRVSLMTGQNAARHRVTQWTLQPGKDQSGVSAHLASPPDWNVNSLAPAGDTHSPRVWRTDVTLPRLLHDTGYRTIHVGKAHWGTVGLPGEDPRAHGFDVNIGGHAAGGPGSYYGTNNFGRAGPWHVPGLDEFHGKDVFLTEALTLKAGAELAKAVRDGVPFFLYLAHYAIHAPLELDPRFADHYPGLDGPEKRYATMIEGMDKSLGDLRQKLRELGVAENTLIVFYSDNGGLSATGRGKTPSGTGLNTHNRPLRAGKGSAYEGGTRVPAIVSWAQADPANPHQQRVPIAAGSVCDTPVIVEDWLPTLLEIAGRPVPARIDGLSLVGTLTGRAPLRADRPLLFHYPHVWYDSLIPMQEGYEMHSALREGDWKVICFYDPPRWELYHLPDDLGETNNLAASNPAVLRRRAARLIESLAGHQATFPVNRETKLPSRPVLP